jgi:Lectin C-type domain
VAIWATRQSTSRRATRWYLHNVRLALLLVWGTGCSFSSQSAATPGDDTIAHDASSDSNGGGGSDANVADAGDHHDAMVPIDARPDATPIDAPKQIDAAGAGCPGDFQGLTGAPATSKYKLYNYSLIPALDKSASYSSAVATCASQQSHLVIVDSAAEAAAIAAVIKVNSFGGSVYRVGVDDLAHPGTWETVLGTPATYLPWGMGQPNGAEGQTSGGFCALLDTNGAMADYFCTTAFPFACECE